MVPLHYLHGSLSIAVASFVLLTLLGPVGLQVISGPKCIAIGFVILAILVWNSPLFCVPSSAIETKDIQPGALLTLCASFTSLILQTHHPLIGYAVDRHSQFTERPLSRLMRTLMFVELALNGSSEEKDKLASWLRQVHRHVRGTVPASVLTAAGLEDVEATYGYTPELMAYVVETLTWSVIAFYKRFGRREQYVQFKLPYSQR